MIGSIIAHLARREFARTVKFCGDRRPDPPVCRIPKPRLLYLHIPFCERLCPYCSFNRVVFDEGTCRSYFAALRKEILLYHAHGFDFTGLYVGGGTPTVLTDELEETVNLATEMFGIREISVETNPNHLNDQTIRALKRMNVSRLSVGVQSYQDELLIKMDRFDKYGNGAAIAARLQEIAGEFTTLNADMIFNFPTQTGDMLKQDLMTLMEIGIDQVTYYPLMVSDYTKDDMARKIGRVTYDREQDFYRLIVESLTPQYRLSSAWCFSRQEKGAIIDEYIVDYDEYAGLGSGSIGYLQGTCFANTFSIPEYITDLNQGKLPIFASRDFSLSDRVRYDFLMKLFGTKMNFAELFSKYGPRAYPGIFLDMLSFFLVGALRFRGGNLHLTRRGAYFWVIMMREFFSAVNNFRDFCRREQGLARQGKEGSL